MSVLTASDREGLKPMAAGLMKRHSDAGVSPPTVLYVDHDWSRGIAMETKRLLSQWFEMEISIDIWHFMRCIAVGCTKVSTKVCCFPWTSFSLHLCMKPGRPKAVNTCHTLQSHKEWSQRSKWGGCHQKISKKKLATHCNRKTPGVKETNLLDPWLDWHIPRWARRWHSWGTTFEC